jgi:hypothetical protein
MTITNVLTQHTVVITTKTNVHKMITDDHPREIAPTPTRAVRAAQAITTETVQHSTMTKISIKISQQHLTSRSTTEIHQTHAAYHSNLNTSQQELLRLHETYAHADMREIQQQIKNCEIKAHRQVATCHIPKCISCSENKGKKRPHKQHRGSITKDDHHPGSNTSIDHVDVANVPGYTWQHK